jgi:phosphoglycerate kinase
LIDILHSALPTYDLANKRVFLRADLNVPLRDSLILNDFRLRALLPTINFILNKGASIILATHIGRPKSPIPSLSTKILIPWFEQHGYSVDYEYDLDAAYKKSYYPHQILLLENVRFFDGETSNDPLFAQRLAALGDFYVNDAFGTLHRTESSIVDVPYLFSYEKRTIGFLIERELRALNPLIENPALPFVVCLGGGKIKTKLPFIEHLLGKATTILLCPALVFTLLKAQGKNVGRSRIEPDLIHDSKLLLTHAQYHAKTSLAFPLDYQIALDEKFQQLIFTDDDAIPDNAQGISIGPRTLEKFSRILKDAKTIFFNAAMGFAHNPETLQSTFALIKAINESNAYSFIAGGDSVMMAQESGHIHNISFFSTGGGATLAYLSGQSLPGLVPFMQLDKS